MFIEHIRRAKNRPEKCPAICREMLSHWQVDI
jgi:hypothetical protein